MNKWDIRFMQMATFVSSFSKDPSTQIGAVCVDKYNRVLGIGFNGFSRNTKDDQRLNIREKKYKMVIHAEHNCLMNCAADVRDAIIYVTKPPCLHCCAIMDQYGIAKVCFEEPDPQFASRWNLNDTREYLEELGIEYSVFRRT